MSPGVAMVVYAFVILALFLLDRDRKSQVSLALWIPIAWGWIGASRMVSEWFGVAPAMGSPDQYLDGSPLDRFVLTGLLVAGLMVLVARGRRAGTFQLTARSGSSREAPKGRRGDATVRQRQ